VTFQERNIAAYLALFFAALFVTIFVHQSATFAGTLPGHLMGIAGAVLMFMALAYPFRKRILGKKGRDNPLTRHILYGLLGSSLAIIHSGHKFGSAIGVIFLVTTFVVVFSGIVGFFLFRKVSRTLNGQIGDLDVLRRRFKAQREDLKACAARRSVKSDRKTGSPAISSGDNGTEPEQRCSEVIDLAYSVVDLENTVAVFSRLKSLFSMWTHVHYFLALFLFSILIAHVLNVFYYGIRWI
jgi:hypothetical protein